MERSCVCKMKPLLTWRPARFKPAKQPASYLFPMCRWPMRNSFRCGVACCLLILMAVSGRADEAQSLDQFLARLGLTDLRLANMERTLARETGVAQRLEL